MSTAIEEIQTGNTPAEMIRAAISGGADLEQLEKLLGLQERWETNEARKAFARDFAKAQSEIDPVVKRANNTQTHSKYALLEGVIEAAQPIYTKYGFSVIFYEGETVRPEHIRINADVLHMLGHKETYYFDVPLDGKGIKGNANMTNIHAKASSTSYGRRYLMCMIWNISTTDNDGNTTGSNTISNEQLNTLRDMLIAIGEEKNESKVAGFFGVASFEELPETEYKKAVVAINARKEQKKKAVSK